MEESIKEAFSLPSCDPARVSSLGLAFLGDAVYELVIRTIVVSEIHSNPNELNRASSALAKAGTQAELYYLLEDALTEEEAAVYRRGRNAHSVTKAKNASVVDYRVATGFEALIGYLYLEGREDRILELVRLALVRREEKGVRAGEEYRAEEKTDGELTDEI